MAARLEDVRRSGIRFGFIFTLTQRNLHELDWVARFEADGTLVPVEHSFPRPFAVGNLQEARLRDLAPTWRSERLADFRALCRAVHEELTTTSCELPFSNWYDAIAERAEQAAA